MQMPPIETDRLWIKPFTVDNLEVVHSILDVQPNAVNDVARAWEARRIWLQWTVLNYEALAALHQPPYGDRAIVLKLPHPSPLPEGEGVRNGGTTNAMTMNAMTTHMETGIMDEGEIIGVCGLVPVLLPFEQLPAFSGDRDGEQGVVRNTNEIGLYWAVARERQRQGYASEAGAALINFAFNELNLKRIVATTTYDNLASIGVMRRLGMSIKRNPSTQPPWLQVVGVLNNVNVGRTSDDTA
jgi:[ribosomal protein S5]-alanine N-acetyltransferase